MEFNQANPHLLALPFNKEGSQYFKQRLNQAYYFIEIWETQLYLFTMPCSRCFDLFIPTLLYLPLGHLSHFYKDSIMDHHFRPVSN